MRNWHDLPERYGRWLLVLAAAAGWTLAAFFANREVIASLWVASGFGLFAAAAFFSRVEEVSREGVKLAKAAEEVKALPTDEKATKDEVRAETVDQLLW